MDEFPKFDEVDPVRTDLIKKQERKAELAAQILKDREARLSEIEHDVIIKKEKDYQSIQTLKQSAKKYTTDKIPQPLKTGARYVSIVGHGAYDVAKSVGRGVQHVANHLEKDKPQRIRTSGRTATRSVPSLIGRGSGSTFGVNENWMKMGGGTNQHRGSSITVNENWGKLGSLTKKPTSTKRKSRKTPKFEYVKVRVRK